MGDVNVGFSSSTTTAFNPYKFSVWRSAAASTGNGAFAQIAFDTVEFDTNNNLSGGTYTVPIAGFYCFTARASATTTRHILALFKNGAEFKRGGDTTTSSSDIGVTLAVFGQFAAADTIDIRSFGATAVALDVSQAQVYFQGFLVSRA